MNDRFAAIESHFDRSPEEPVLTIDLCSVNLRKVHNSD